IKQSKDSGPAFLLQYAGGLHRFIRQRNTTPSEHNQLVAARKINRKNLGIVALERWLRVELQNIRRLHVGGAGRQYDEVGLSGKHPLHIIPVSGGIGVEQALRIDVHYGIEFGK